MSSFVLDFFISMNYNTLWVDASQTEKVKCIIQDLSYPEHAISPFIEVHCSVLVYKHHGVSLKQ